MSPSHKPTGHTTVSPYLIVDGADRTIAWLFRVLGAQELRRSPTRQAGSCMRRLDDTVVVLADSKDGWPAVASYANGYIPGFDHTYGLALEASATASQQRVKAEKVA